MKQARHKIILDLIANEMIATQEQLTQRLQEMRCPTTQATVSRDIRELGLHKTLDAASGLYHYSAPTDPIGASARLNIIFREAVLSCESAQNLVVIRTMPGLAGAAGAAIDSLPYDGIAGTISGDDTVFVAMRNVAAAKKFTEDIGKLIT